MPKSSAGPAVVQLAASKSSTKSKSSKALANKFSAATSGLLTMQMKVVAVAKSGAYDTRHVAPSLGKTKALEGQTSDSRADLQASVSLILW